MAEWLKAAVLKTARLARVSGVRIPLPPPRYWLASGGALSGFPHGRSMVRLTATAIWRDRLKR